MRGDIIVPVAMLTAIIWAVGLVATSAIRGKAYGWMIGGVLCLAVAFFCLFGFAASFEPGGGLGWKIGYETVGLLFLAAAGLQSARVLKKGP